jgi:plastocyanin
MSRRVVLMVVAVLACPLPAGAERLAAQENGSTTDSSRGTVDIKAPSTAEAGQRITLSAVGKDARGKALKDPVAAWFALPMDRAVIDSTGSLALTAPGEVEVGAVVAGNVGFARIEVKPAPVATVEVDPLPGPLVVGGALPLQATPRAPNGDPRLDAPISWTSERPAVARVDAGGGVTGVAPGRATIRASSGEGSGTLAVEVVTNPVRSLAIEPASATARTGDVVRFSATAAGDHGAIEDPFVRWAVSGEGAEIEQDGGFVAEKPGRYAVTATSGEHVAVGSVVVSPRRMERKLEVVGRAPAKEFETAEQWVIGNYVYLSSIADRVWVYDVSDPAHPVKTDSIQVDARIVNDVSTTPDGKLGVLTREGASNRKNGVVFFDASDPAHPKVISEYSETVTGGVHSAYIDGHYAYITDDATGSLRVIDFGDVKNPKEVARWQVENPLYRKTDVQGAGAFSSGRYLHDVQVKDGLIYLAYWRDGLVILDVGKGIKGGSPEHPQLVSQLRFNHNELYGPGWLAGTHTVFRYKDYVFVGDEVFPGDWGLNPTYEKRRVPTRGVLHVVDVSDIEHPKVVAEYPVPEAGSHNVWVEDDVLVMGYYAGGGRVLDVSGELRGNLYAQGREIARLYTGDPDGYVANTPFTWGAQPHAGLIFFNDINSGLWITKLGPPRDEGSTTAPGY